MSVASAFQSLRGAACLGLALSLMGCGPRETARDAPAVVSAAPELTAPSTSSATLKAVLTRGRLNCGVHPGLVGFSFQDNSGRWRGFDVDFCRAMAAAIFSDADRVNFIPLSTSERFKALQTGKVDVLWRSTSWTLSRDAGDGVDFAGVNYYDGQGFLVRKSLRLNSATELQGARICVQTGSTSELNLTDYFRTKGLKFVPVVVRSEDEGRDNYAKGACDALTADVSALAAARSTLDDPQGHMILPEIISKEPLGPVVRQGDDAWADIVRWTLYATIMGEELGITSQKVEDIHAESTHPEIRRLLGAEGNLGGGLGLGPEWGYNILRQVGNYGEIFERNIGEGSPLRLSRGLNAQWNAPERGLIYAPPVR
ncbi:amino acid ABC transporter substrate-binding protein [Asticcacaulis sp. BYS171W]|uniref:Amino acid ABC transporter substrate-binding protein n=1 Tax=Asticcacaulis aquaticus TaxID=2984212 RepID=A0ABT5HNZ3_9CAUL|nr:amino acid ABC transporter substrate-binding protein [Asticcacaulis aquaticus]MDC7681779.1 amino acid ABC transporter substrate-binding protein [Asticcacaulis aquaticus]